jgi:ADP-ribose pyrophosphatase
MRKEKLEELYGYVELLKTKKKTLLEKTGNFINVEKYLIELNNGEVINREKISKGNSDGNASIVLPVTVDGNVILVVQPRVFTRIGVGIELPAGYVDKGEDYEDAARRELFEETGYVPENVRLLGEFYQDQGCSGAYNKSFLAEGCRKIGSQSLDSSEFIKYFECSVDELYELVELGMINDLQSQYTIEKAKQYIRR